MSVERVREIIRHFPENGLKQVLTSPETLRELLAIAQAAMLARIEFAGMEIDPTTYVTAEYRHVSSDLVLTVSLRPTRRGGRKKRVKLTLLIELQMQPDRLMLLRVLEYLVQIWKHEVKRHADRHGGSLASVKLSPVLPIVLHTGSYSWEKLGTLLDLMDDAVDFAEVTPMFRPLFISLPNVSESELEDRGGGLGQVLALLKARKSARAVFASRLSKTVSNLEELRGEQRGRRLELLSYVEGLVYHSREAGEHGLLRERINAALQHDETRLEVDVVRRTMADVHREEGALAANRQTLIDQLQVRWGPLSAELEHTIQTTENTDQLKEWLRRFATAKDLKSIGISAGH